MKRTVFPLVALLITALGLLSILPAQDASAGINVWTTHGPERNIEVFSMAIDPATPSTLYIGTFG